MSAAAPMRPAPAARYALLATTLLLAVGGVLMIWSASSAADFSEFGDSAFRLKKQLLFLGVGLVGLYVASKLSADTVRRLAWPFLILTDALLVAVLFIGVGKWGAVRWIDLGFTTIQPSEFAKLGCVLVAAAIMADRQRRPGPVSADILRLAAAVGIPFVLVMLQPDMGTAMSILMAVFFVLFLGGLQWRWVGAVIAGLLVATPVMILSKGYRADRLAGFLDPEKDPLGNGFQILQAKLAFGSGGLTGVGLGLSRQKYFYLPAAHTDFIFAIIGEETGLVGTMLVVVAFGVFLWAGIRIALAIKDPFARLVVGGLTVMIVTQAAINMMSVTGLMPVTGVPLPLVSYGGSSMLFTLGCIGLILAMTRGSARSAARGESGIRTTEGTSRARTGERRGDGRPHLSGIDGGKARGKRRA